MASVPLTEILNTTVEIDVVDIGANPIDAEVPYLKLLKAGRANVVGFEPNPEALAKLEADKGKNETYLPYAVADGKTHEFKVCGIPGMSSLLEPNQELLQYFHGFPDWGKVDKREIIKTVCLDDVEDITNLDYLKIDVQGGELCVFENGINRLSECLVIHTEVEFLPMYVDQPLFSEVEFFLRKEGFVLHRFAPLTSRLVSPLILNDDIYTEFSQVFWADAVFIRDFTKLSILPPEKLLKFGVILHDIYGSFDLVLRILMAYDEQTDLKYADLYMEWLENVAFS
jgi:FkbM family methyltransferase